MRALLFLLLTAASLVTPVYRAAACTGYYEMAALRPGSVVFSSDGSVAWVLTDHHRWVRVDASGGRHEVPVGAVLSRMIASPAGTLVVVGQGLMYPSCDVDWHRLDRIELGPGGGGGPAGGAGGQTRGGIRTATPRLLDFSALWSLGVSPDGGRAATASFDRLAVVDFPSRRVLHSFEAERAMVAWLDGDHLAWLAGDGVRVLDVRDGSRSDPIAVSSPFAPSEQPAPTGAEALLPGHPSCMDHGEPRIAVLDADATPAALTLVAMAGSECDRWQLLRVQLTGGAPAVAPAAWIGDGHLLALSASGTRVAVLRRGAVEVLDRETGQPLARVTGRWPVVAASLAPDGSQLGVASRRPVRRDPDDYDEEWDLAAGGRGELGVEIFHLDDGARRTVIGGVPPSRLRIPRPRP